MFKQAQQELSTLRDLLRFSVSRLSEANLFFGHGTDNAWDEAAYLLLHTLHLPLDRLEPFLDARLTSDERAQALTIIERRITERVPAAYLTHEAWLGDARFYVDERVIVPRSHIAELLREQLSPWLSDPSAVRHALDMCTGSGCLAVLAAEAFPDAHIDAVDLSPDALAVAQRNVSDYGLEARIELIESNAFAALAGKRYDLILSNPPYVTAESMAILPAEYRHEPRLALAGGEDGLDFVHILLAQAAAHLTPQGLLVVEIGHNQYALEQAYPETSFIWLDTGYEEPSVFALARADLPSKTLTQGDFS